MLMPKRITKKVNLDENLINSLIKNKENEPEVIR